MNLHDYGHYYKIRYAFMANSAWAPSISIPKSKIKSKKDLEDRFPSEEVLFLFVDELKNGVIVQNMLTQTYGGNRVWDVVPVFDMERN